MICVVRFVPVSLKIFLHCLLSVSVDRTAQIIWINKGKAKGTLLIAIFF